MNTWLNEYLEYISKKTEEFVVNFETEIDDNQAEVVMAEIKNQIRYMEGQLEIMQLQMKNLPEDEAFIKKLSVNISDSQKRLLQQGYVDQSSFKHQLKEKLGKGEVKQVLNELLIYASSGEKPAIIIEDKILLFNSRMAGLEFKFRAGTITFDEERSEKQKIISSILGFINDLE